MEKRKRRRPRRAAPLRWSAWSKRWSGRRRSTDWARIGRSEPKARRSPNARLRSAQDQHHWTENTNGAPPERIGAARMRTVRFPERRPAHGRSGTRASADNAEPREQAFAFRAAMDGCASLRGSGNHCRELRRSRSGQQKSRAAKPAGRGFGCKARNHKLRPLLTALENPRQ